MRKKSEAGSENSGSENQKRRDYRSQRGQRVLRYLEQGHSFEEAASAFYMSIEAVRYVVAKSRAESTEDAQDNQPEFSPGAAASNWEALRVALEKQDSLSLLQAAEQFKIPLRAALYAKKQVAERRGKA